MGKSRNSGKAQKRVAETKSVISTRTWLLGLLLGVSFFAFFNTLANGFVYDDRTQIIHNPFIRSLSNIPTAMVTEAWFWRTQKDKDPNKQEKPSTPYYRPMILIYFMIGWQLFGSSAAGWHLANILMHVAIVYFVFLILEKVTGDLRITSVATLLFAIHPLRSESVAWISGVTDLLLALAILSAFYLYLGYRESGKPLQLAASLSLFLLAAFSKEPAVCLPLFIVAYEILIVNQEKPFKERLKIAVTYGSVYFLIMGIYFEMRHIALGFWLNDQSYTNYKTLDVLLTIPLIIWKYLGLLLWPVNLSLFHSTPLVETPMSMRFILPATGLIGLAPAVWFLRKSFLGRFAFLWFAINLLPVLNLHAFNESFMVQERYIYIPSIGFSLLLAMALVKIPLDEWIAIGSRRTAMIAIAALLALVLTGKTLAQNAVWKDEVTLYSHGSQVASDQFMPHYVLGHEYIKRQRYDLAAQELEECIRIDPGNEVVLTNLPSAHIEVYTQTRERAHLDRAIELCEKGLSKNDRSASLWDTLGHVYTFETELKNYARARAFFARALAIQPDLFISNFHMGATYIKEGDVENGIRFLEIARRQAPGYAETYKFLAYAYSDSGRVGEAVEQLSRYLELQPNAPDAAREAEHLETLRARLRGENSQG